MVVVFLFGPAASGKHTVGSQLSKLSGLPLFHNHLAVDAAKALFEFGSPGFNRTRATLWHTAFSEAAADQRSFIFTFHPEASVDPALVEELVSSIEAPGGRVLFVELVCPRETVIQRLDSPSRAAFGKLTDPQLYCSLEAQGAFEFPPLPPPALRIDTSVVTAVDAAQQIAVALEKSSGPTGPQPRARSVTIKNTATAEHYLWGEGCDGWRHLNGSDLSVIQERMGPGAGEPLHLHRSARQLFFVLSGTLRIDLNGIPHTLGEHDSLEVPPQVPHRVENSGGVDVHFLVVSCPTSRGDRTALTPDAAR
jgi:mannose-6-phosphate isomerase-like protein (cupin superfamily)